MLVRGFRRNLGMGKSLSFIYGYLNGSDNHIAGLPAVRVERLA
jgi:hypothetical protein